MRVVIAGGTGFLGRALTNALQEEDGNEVVLLTRRAAGPAPPPPGFGGLAAGSSEGGGPVQRIAWAPDGKAGPWAGTLDGADAVVNLAGESIAAGRWTAARKKAILESRVLATRSLVTAVAAAEHPPAAFLSASAQGYYGERGDEEVTEEDGPGKDFLASVCVAWEAEARKAEGTSRLVLLRTGVVLSDKDGALPPMIRPFRVFGGGPVGSGRQYLPWIHYRDWVAIVLWVLRAAQVAGPLNLSAPTPVRNRDLAAAISRALHRPSWLPVPALALRAALGEMADALLLTSTRMVPRRALALGYRFQFGDLDGALENLLVEQG
jgi:uncharacterized protein (TIGR01777 family)